MRFKGASSGRLLFRYASAREFGLLSSTSEDCWTFSAGRELAVIERMVAYGTIVRSELNGNEVVVQSGGLRLAGLHVNAREVAGRAEAFAAVVARHSNPITDAFIDTRPET